MLKIYMLYNMFSAITGVINTPVIKHQTLIFIIK